MTSTNHLNAIKDLPPKLNIGRSKIYEEIASGRLQSVRVGSRRLVPESAVIAYIEGLIEAASSTPLQPLDPCTTAEATAVQRPTR